MTRRKNQEGFPLLELLLVVAVILIISAIAIPNLLRSRMTANEAAAVGTLRAVNASCVAYSSNWGIGYPVSLLNLGPAKPATAAAADLVDSTVAGGTKSGYALTYISSAPNNGKIWTYTINANPVVPGQTGGRYFFTDQSGVIRYNSGGPATVSSPPIS
ncbi:MAG TPA: prepilin-type N-terminal cleavage/methylation domain-containing protein [Candidatus Acidoferrum sp.]